MGRRTLLVATLLCCTVTPFTNAFPVGTQKNHLSRALEFLDQFGYIDISSAAGNLLEEKSLSESLKKMQRFAGLNETGQLDNETLALMNASRCGVPDYYPSSYVKRSKRFALHPWKWPKGTLTWRIHNYGNDGIPKTLIRKTFKNALSKWERTTNLQFKEIVTGEPDIWFKFAIGAHDDPTPFKRPWDGVIAHAYYPKHSQPGLAGDIHFNDDKKFSIASYKGKNLPWVTLHEIGHSIGLEHSKVKGSMMYPYYQIYNGKESELTVDDIKGAQALYGIKHQSTTSRPATPKISSCFGKIDAMFLGADKKTYVFSKRKLFIFSKSLSIDQGPIAIWKIFKGVKSVDAAFTRHDGKTVLFSSGKYFVFNSRNMYVSGPHQIKSTFKGLANVPGKIDAAFIWPKTDALYIMKGNKYWRYYPIGKGESYGIAPGYPKDIARSWKRVPQNIDAAYTWINGATYLFKGNKYYRLTRSFKVELGYPKLTSKYWADTTSCGSQSDSVLEEKNSASKSGLFSSMAISLVVMIFYLLH